MIFFDSESKVHTEITDDEIYRAEQGEKVTKEHLLYLVCANFYNTSSKKKERYRDYVGVIGEKNESIMYRFWSDVDRFSRQNENMYVFAHNAKYDVQVTQAVPILVSLGYEVTGFSDSNPFILDMEKFIRSRERKLKNGRIVKERICKKITLVSSTNYYQQSLAKLGKVFGLKKLEFDHDEPFTIEKAVTYCRRDVEILSLAMVSFFDFIERENLGSFSLTIAGQAFKSYRHRFMPHDSIFIHDDDRALRVERDAYAGGRTECFWMGKVPYNVYYVDVNSMYPYVMKNRLYPTKLKSFWRKATIKDVRELIKNDYLICADCRIRTETPLFHKKRKRLIFPTGDFWTTLSTPEIIQAMERGLLVEIENICIYECGDIFSEYVDYFYSERLKAKKKNDEVHDFLYKIFLNALYGKFGQKNIVMEQVEKAPMDMVAEYTVYDPIERTREQFKVFGGWVWKRNTDPENIESYNSFPAIAAHVTAYARMLLWDAIETAGRENVFYTDTDSLFVNFIGYHNLDKNNLLDDSELGKLKLEKEGRLELFGCKDYIFTSKTNHLKVKKISKNTNKNKININAKIKKGILYETKIKIKGISSRAKKIENSPDGKLRFAVTQWGGFSDRLRDGDFSKFYNKIIIKELKREYNKGNIDGNIVTPYFLDFEKEKKENEEKEYLDYMEKLKQGKIDSDILKYDHIKELCKIHGHIRVVRKGEMYFSEYMKMKKENRIKYFRIDGVPLDVWASATGYDTDELLQKLI